MEVVKVISITALLLSAACSGDHVSKIQKSSCEVPQDVFSADYKVGLNAVENSMSESRVRFKKLRAGRELDVILKNSCDAPGEISARIARDPHARSKNGSHSYSWRLDRDVDLETFKKWATEDACVVGVSDDAVLSHNDVIAENEPKLESQTFLSSIRAKEAWPLFYDPSLGIRKTVVVAVVDSGVALTHPDLKSVLWTNAGEIAGNGIDDDNNGYVDDLHGYNFADANGDPTNAAGKDHGTHVAGLAAAQGNNGVGVSGTMPIGARVMALNVFGASDTTRGSSTANAVRYAADNGADIVNLSLGGGFSETLKSAIVYAIKKGVTVLAAAGNSGLRLGTETQLAPGVYGSSLNGLITVGSVSSGTLAWSSFSNYGANSVEIAAPGQGGMLSTLPGDTYGYKSGTSMATPVTAGAAALAIQLIRARGFAATPARVELALKTSGTMRATLVSKVRGGKILNLKSLAEYVNANYRDGTEAPNPPEVPDESELITGVPCS